MLKSLDIQNYALIEKLSLHPDSGFNIVTGETGAGKSIMLGAVGLLLGNRADVKTLFDEGQKCIVEGEFDVETYQNLKDVFEQNDLEFEPSCLIRREVHPNGKSRAFVNDSPVTLDLLKQITPLLIDIHSQHETQFLAEEKYQLNLLDELGDHAALLASYRVVYRELTKVRQAVLQLQEGSARQQKESDFIAFQLDELLLANVQVGEKEELEQELAALAHAEEIQMRLFEALGSLSEGELAGLQLLKQAQSAMAKIASYSPKFEELRFRLDASFIELKDVAGELSNAADGAQTSNNERQQEIEERLAVIYRLEKKHQVEAQQLTELLTDLKKRILQFESSDAQLEALLDQSKELEKELGFSSAALSQVRKNVAEPIQKQITDLLVELSMPFAQFSISISARKPSLDGADAITFLFSANKGSEPKSMKQVASGGEFSRLMLAIKYVIAGKTALPTLIFDEIDTGVSGEVAAKMGRLMQGMSTRHQVLTITHTAQIAAMGTRHFFVEKAHTGQKTSSQVRLLSPDDRIQEIAQMISGDRITDAAIQNAKELLRA